MKKVLLAFILSLGFLGYSQGTSCAAATAITANGTFTVSAITGTYYSTTCPGGEATGVNAPTAGAWYSYTPASNGLLTITSDLTQNDGTAKSDETRLSVFTGTCSALTCFDGSDDINSAAPPAGNYLSELVDMPVAAGTTYYIQWDNQWGATLPFDFEVTFTAQSCIPIDTNTLTITNLTPTTATIDWDPAVGNPASYDIEYGAPGFTQGTGTMANSLTDSYNFSGTSGGNYYFYVRSNCGASQSTWSGPFALYLAKTLPYTTSFETAPAYSDGFAAAGWSLANNPGYPQDGLIFYFTNTSTTAASNSQLYSRALSLGANEQVTFTYWTRMAIGTGTTATLKPYFNTTRSMTGATAIGTPITVSGATYVQQTSTFTAPTAGNYYVIFSNESPIVTADNSLLIDNINFTSTSLGVNDIKALEFADVYPNPAKDFVKVDAKSKVKNVEVFDMSGRKVNAKFNDNQIDVRGLQTGNYIINIQTEEGTITKQIIKE